MHPHRITCKVHDLIRLFEWEEDDDIVVEVGGTAVSGIYQPDTANPKWSTPFGVRKYNKDAFIVVKNKDRNPTVSSVADPTLIGHHLKNEQTIDDCDCGSPDCPRCTGGSKD